MRQWVWTHVSCPSAAGLLSCCVDPLACSQRVDALSPASAAVMHGAAADATRRLRERNASAQSRNMAQLIAVVMGAVLERSRSLTKGVAGPR